jgi:hypothetical protein
MLIGGARLRPRRLATGGFRIDERQRRLAHLAPLGHIRAVLRHAAYLRTGLAVSASFTSRRWAVAQASIPIRQGGSALKNPGSWLRRSALRSTIIPSRSTPCSWKTFFAISTRWWRSPTCHWLPSVFMNMPILPLMAGISDAGGGRHPRHQRNLTVSQRCAPIGAQAVPDATRQEQRYDFA